MTNREIGFELGRLAREERKITNELLKVISLGFERRAYREHGFSSMFDWLVKGFGYSNAAAYRRIEAARLLRAVPQAEAKLEAGEINLTTLSQAQSAIKAQEKASGKRLSAEIKAELVEKIQFKSAEEAQQILYALLPEAKLSTNQERRTVIDENTIRHSMNFTTKMSEDLKRAKEVLSHKMPNASDADIVGFALSFLLEKLDPLRKPTSGAEAKRVTKSGARRVILKNANAACTYRDPVTGQLCGSRHQVELDHIVPKAMGGTDDPENLRPLCRVHNLLVAELVFGEKHMDQFRTGAP